MIANHYDKRLPRKVYVMAKKPKKGLIFRIIVVTVLLILCILGGVAATLVASVLKTIPNLEDIKFDPKLATSIYDRNGKLIQRLFTENRTWVSLDEIPDQLEHALVAIEDHKFYDHHGIDPVAIIRSVLLNIKNKSLTAYGGSTITQQLAKNAFLTQNKKLIRKIKEAIWAIQIERGYTKDEILETYLNVIWFGHGAHGVEAASQVYFGKRVKDLNLEEIALIAGVTNNPGMFSPRYNMEAAKKRRDLVLRRMAEEGYITQEVYENTKEKPIVLKEKSTDNIKTASYFVDQVLQYLLDKFDSDKVYGGGLKVYTTLDLDKQIVAEETLLNTLPKGSVDKNGLTQPQVGLITLDPKTGEILVMVGGRGEDKLNRAFQTYRQPGSSFKPFIYATALSQGYTPAQIFIDEPVEYKTPTGELWSVRNYHRDYKGPISLRYALEMSTNVIAVKLLDQVGIDNVCQTIKNLGITSLVEYGVKNDKGLAPLALGALTKGVSLLQMSLAYGVFANQGIYCEPYFITKIEEPSGKVIERNYAKPRTVMDEKVAYLLTDMLKGVVSNGTAKQANIARPQAGKTGTTDNYQDAWFVGYIPEMVTAIWVGEDLPREMVYNGVRYGSWDCARIWGNYMKQIVEGIEPTDFIRPEGLLDLKVCTESGLIASSYCPEDKISKELFIKGTEPKAVCTLHEPQTPSKDRNMIPLDDWQEDEDTGSNFISNIFGIFGSKSSQPQTIQPETETKTETETEKTLSPDQASSGEDPDYIVTVEICPESNKVATPACPQSKLIKVKYLKGAEPTEECDIHGGWQ